MNQTDPARYLWWLASRASGVVALGLITVSVGLGLLMAGRVMSRPGLTRVLMPVHRQTALAGLFAIAVHGITLLGDPWLRPGVGGVLVPFTLSYRPLFTGLGLLGAYLAALLGLSFYARHRIGARRWRRLHRLTVLVYVLAVAHTLGAGTDAGTAWMRTAILAPAVPLFILFVLRVVTGRGGRVRASPGVTRRSRPPTSPSSVLAGHQSASSRRGPVATTGQ